jgi:hypothetical protein
MIFKILIKEDYVIREKSQKNSEARESLTEFFLLTNV